MRLRRVLGSLCLVLGGAWEGRIGFLRRFSISKHKALSHTGFRIDALGFQGSGISKDLQILRARRSGISECLGTGSRRPVAGFQ
jgi:hypothetical protein